MKDRDPFVSAWAARTFERLGGTAALRVMGDRYILGHKGLIPTLKVRSRNPFQILIYHRVQPQTRPFMLDTMDVERFDRQMGHLAKRYRVLPLSEILALSVRGNVPPRTVAVTFDDGYRDNHTHALPVLERHAIPATIFLTTRCIDTGELLWHDQVLHAFANTRRDRYRDPSRDESVELRSSETREALAHTTLGRLKRMTHEDRERAISTLCVELDVDRLRMPRDSMLRWDDIRDMARRGIEFGSHTVTHPILSRESRERVTEELVESKRTIERELARPIASLAYPNGTPADYTQEAIDAARTAGYQCALTTVFGPNEPGDDPFQWRRGTPWERDPSLFSLKLALYRALEVSA